VLPRAFLSGSQSDTMIQIRHYLYNTSWFIVKIKVRALYTYDRYRVIRSLTLFNIYIIKFQQGRDMFSETPFQLRPFALIMLSCRTNYKHYK